MLGSRVSGSRTRPLHTPPLADTETTKHHRSPGPPTLARGGAARAPRSSRRHPDRSARGRSDTHGLRTGRSPRRSRSVVGASRAAPAPDAGRAGSSRKTPRRRQEAASPRRSAPSGFLPFAGTRPSLQTSTSAASRRRSARAWVSLTPRGRVVFQRLTPLGWGRGALLGPRLRAFPALERGSGRWEVRARLSVGLEPGNEAEKSLESP